MPHQFHDGVAGIVALLAASTTTRRSDTGYGLQHPTPAHRALQHCLAVFVSSITGLR